MYHPSRGGVRGGRDQFKWDDVKVDKHRENYIGHSLKAPVGRWQKGKDLFWYTRDKNSAEAEAEAAKEEIRKIKEQEEQAMRELLGLAPKSSNRTQGSRLTKHEYADLLKKGSTVEEGDSYAEGSRVPGIGFAKGPRPDVEFESLSGNNTREIPSDVRGSIQPRPNPQINHDADPGESRKKRDRKESSRQEKHEDRHRSSKEKGKEKREKGKRRRHDSDSD